ncbi:MAG TPA: class I lanthipeptide [Thermoanaerobaculia bacterium]|nr:class I lanthipeptide [Thermoanaerobaculia bacterium]
MKKKIKKLSIRKETVGNLHEVTGFGPPQTSQCLSVQDSMQDNCVTGLCYV